MKQVAEYIIPIIQDGKNTVPDFLQAKELIRCKDCKLFGDPKCLMCLDGYDWAEPDGYCHMAERRTNADD